MPVWGRGRSENCKKVSTYFIECQLPALYISLHKSVLRKCIILIVRNRRKQTEKETYLTPLVLDSQSPLATLTAVTGKFLKYSQMPNNLVHLFILRLRVTRILHSITSKLRKNNIFATPDVMPQKRQSKANIIGSSMTKERF